MMRFKVAFESFGICFFMCMFGFLSLFLVACKEKKENANEPERIELVGKEIGLALPHNTKVLGFRRESGLDDMIQVKLEMPVSDWNSFLKGLPIRQGDFREEKRFLLGADGGWWNPQSHSELPTCQIQQKNNRFVNMGFYKKSTTIVVYIVNHGI